MKKVFLFSILALLVLTTSCNGTTTTGTVKSEIDDEATVTITNATGASDTPSTEPEDTETTPDTVVTSWHFPQLKAPSDAYMEALLTGTLELTDGFLTVDGYIIIWQSEYSADNSSGMLEILDTEGTVVGRVGEPIQMGGGTGTPNNAMLKERLPAGTTGPFWIQGEGTQLYIEPEVAVTIPPDQSAVADDESSSDSAPSLDEVIFPAYDARSLETILADIPVYPGSVPSNNLTENSEPIAKAQPAYVPALLTGAPATQIVSTEYSVNGTAGSAIMSYYQQYFSDESLFEKGIDSTTLFGTSERKAQVYSFLRKPGFRAEIQVFTSSDDPLVFFQLLVVEDLTLSIPFNPNLVPNDISSIQIRYEENDSITITDSRVLSGIANLINRMPVHPPFIVLGPLPPLDGDISADFLYSLTFSSSSQGIITFTYMVGFYSSETGLYLEDETILWDTLGLLLSKIQQITGLYYPQ